MDLFGRQARQRLAEVEQHLLMMEGALEKAALEVRLFRAVQNASNEAWNERFSISDRQQALNESYVQVMAYLFVAQENVRRVLGRRHFYNIQALYPPVTSDDTTMQDFFVSVRRHLFG